MPVATVNEKPSLVSDLSALAGLYRTVFHLMGRKAQYGRVWPREADMAAPGEAMGTTELLIASQAGPATTSSHSPVEAAIRD